MEHTSRTHLLSWRVVEAVVSVAWMDRTMAYRAMVWGRPPMSVMSVGLGCVELPPMFWIVCFGGGFSSSWLLLYCVVWWIIIVKDLPLLGFEEYQDGGRQ